MNASNGVMLDCSILQIVFQKDYSEINFPVNKKHYPISEQRFSINLNVFYYYNKRVYPLYISGQHNERVFNVLLISDEEKSHYVFIKDFNRMMRSQAVQKTITKNFIACISSEKWSYPGHFLKSQGNKNL